MHSAAARDDHFNTSLAVSAGLHIAFLLFIFFGLPHLIKPLPEHHDPVPFEIVELSELTNTRIKETPEPAKPTPPPTPTPPPAQAQPVQQTPPPQQPPQPKPTPPQAMPQPPQPLAESIKPKPVERVKPAEQPKPAPDLMASVLKNVAKLKPAEQPKPDQQTKPDVKAQPQAPAKSAAPSLSDRLTISEEDSLRRQIENCWNPPIGARDVQSLIVELVIVVNPDKTVANAEIVDKGRYSTDTFFRAAADAAMRAVRNPQCSPLALPDGKYDQWKRINFTFDPRDML